MPFWDAIQEYNEIKGMFLIMFGLGCVSYHFLHKRGYDCYSKTPKELDYATIVATMHEVINYINNNMFTTADFHQLLRACEMYGQKYGFYQDHITQDLKRVGLEFQLFEMKELIAELKALKTENKELKETKTENKKLIEKLDAIIRLNLDRIPTKSADFANNKNQSIYDAEGKEIEITDDIFDDNENEKERE